MTSHLTAETKKRIEARITELESQTSIEFVPVVTSKSSSYDHLKTIYALFGLAVSLEFFLLRGDFSTHLFKSLVALSIGIGIRLLLEIEIIGRLLIPARAKLHAVETKAHEVFLHEEVFDTPQRTGILIFISEFERAVYILADKGFAKKVEAAEWAALGHTLAKDFSTKSEGETFLKALDELSKRLAKDFPHQGKILSRLPNNIREV